MTKWRGFNSILSAGQFAPPLMEFCSSVVLKWTINMSLGKNIRLSHSCFWRVKRAFLLPHSQETPNVCCLLRGYWGQMSFAFYYSVKIHLKWMAITWVSKSTWDWSSKIIAGMGVWLVSLHNPPIFLDIVMCVCCGLMKFSLNFLFLEFTIWSLGEGNLWQGSDNVPTWRQWMIHPSLSYLRPPAPVNWFWVFYWAKNFDKNPVVDRLQNPSE